MEASSEDFKAHGVPPEGLVASCSHLAILVETGTEVTQPPLNDLSVIPWLPMTVEVSVARSVLQRLRTGICFAIVGDSEFLVNCCLGEACTNKSNLKKLLNIAQEALKQLAQGFSVKPFLHKQLVIHTPRGDNSAADAAANRALDEGDFWNVYPEEVHSFCQYLHQHRQDQNIGLLFSFDGASRGNPGAASPGNCGWWGEWSSNQFCQKGLLYEKGCTIGRRSNNVAEVRGLAFSAKSALHFLFWLCETCAELAASRRYV